MELVIIILCYKGNIQHVCKAVESYKGVYLIGLNCYLIKVYT